MKRPFFQPDPPPSGQFWFTEYHSPASGITVRVEKTLFSGRSDFQDISLFETEDYGRMLVLDGSIQTTERDEFVYHEMIVHVPLLAHPAPRPDAGARSRGSELRRPPRPRASLSPVKTARSTR